MTVSDPVLIAAIGALQVLGMGALAYHQAKIAAAQAVLNTNVQKIETATNSMKDALVLSTAKASKAEGVVEGHAQGIADAVSGKVVIPAPAPPTAHPLT